MRFNFKQALTKLFVLAGLALPVSLSSVGSAFAQEKGPEKKSEKKSEKADEKSDADQQEPEEKEEEVNPFALPEDASVEELFDFIKQAKRVSPKERTMKAYTAHYKAQVPAIIAAADEILAKSEDADEQIEAISEKFSSYSILTRYAPEAKNDARKLAEEFASDERPEIAATAMAYLLGEKAAGVRSATGEEAAAIADEALALLDKFGVTKVTYSPASSIATSLGYSEHTEIAAKLYENMAPYFRKAEDERYASRADTMLGAARRMRLMGNSMEVFGTKADGEAFDLDDYKGKVVLVDFWASWCGPCIGELPNMKKNLERYGEKGFEIVGINMDSTREAFEKCVESKEITWVNIVSEEEDANGWAAPMATHYGITGIPTAILLDQSGKVVSLRARGSELDKQLETLLGPIEEPESEDGDGDDEEKGDDGDK